MCFELLHKNERVAEGRRKPIKPKVAGIKSCRARRYLSKNDSFLHILGGDVFKASTLPAPSDPKKRQVTGKISRKNYRHGVILLAGKANCRERIAAGAD